MIEVYPSYYNKFRCIADRCRHNCCIGWEIDVDEKTLCFYNTLDGEMGDKIRRSIDAESASFTLCDGERCPMLNENGLCDIMLKYGHDALCDICRNHPRFSNVYSGFCETGLGLCCEEAARIVLSEKEPFVVQLPEKEVLSEREKEFFGIRNEIFETLQNRQKTIYQRLCDLAKSFELDFRFDIEKLRNTYLCLERLDEEWTERLNELSCFCFDEKVFSEEKYQLPFEQLSVYFVFRHLTDAVWYGDFRQRVGFVLESVYLLGALVEKRSRNGSFEEMVDLVRMYSAEIEYSTENVDSLLEQMVI